MFKVIQGIYKKILVISIVTLFLVSMVFFVSPGKVHGDLQPLEVWVDGNYSEISCGGHTWNIDAFKTIREGILSVASGGTVYVGEGTYTETGEIEITKPLKIIGANSGEGSGYNDKTIVKVIPLAGSLCDTILWVHNCSSVDISWLTLDRAGTSSTGIVFTGGCDFGNSRVHNCKVKGGLPDNAGGNNCFIALEVIQSDNVIFEKNIVEGIIDGDYAGGIGEIGGCEGIVIKNNEINGLGIKGSGISCVMAGSVNITGNKVTGCKYGIYENQVNLVIEKNEIYGNDIGIQAGAWTMEFHQNSIYDNLWNLSCGYTEAEKVDATFNYWGVTDRDSILNKIDGNALIDPWLINPVSYVAQTETSRPLTPEEQVSLELSIEQQVILYGADNIGLMRVLYDNMLGRVPDSEGENNWITALNEGSIGLRDVIFGFVFSKELESKILPAGPEEFVTFLYKNVLNRDSDPDGFNNWISLMGNGMTKEEVLLHFIDSDEFQSICEMFGIKP